MKKIALILALPIVFFMLLGIVSAAPYEIQKVTINGVEASADRIALQTGTNVQLDIVAKGMGAATDVKIKAWIGGYEYDDVYAETETFEIRSNITYRKELLLELPRDMSVIEGHDYVLHIEIKDRNDFVEAKYTVYLEPPRHDVNIQDVIIRPSTMAEAGNLIGVQVRLENFGEKTEKDIKVEASLVQLGSTAITYVDALDRYEGEDTSESTSFMMLTIPEGTLTGDYQLRVKAIFASGHKESVAMRNIYARGKDANEKYAEELAKDSIVSVVTRKELAVNSTALFRIAIANIGDEKKAYTVEVPLIEWGVFEIKPDKLELGAGDSSEITLAVLPAVAGVQQMTITVKEGDTIIRQDSASFNVVSIEQKETNVDKVNSVLKGVDKRTVMLALAGVLILALLIAVIAGTRARY